VATTSGPGARNERRIICDVGKLAIAATGVVAGVCLLALARAQPIRSARPPALLTYAAVFAKSLVLSRPPRGAIWVGRADGSGRRRLLGGTFLGDPAWSPRGRLIAFTRRTGGTGPQEEISIADARGRFIRNLSQGYAFFNRDPTWSPNGKQIAFAFSYIHAGAIAIANADGSDKHPLANGLFGIAGSPSWSPNGREILYSEASITSDTDVFVIDADGQNNRLLVHNAMQPVYSPDGSKIAYVSVDYQHTGGNIVIENADGSHPHVITHQNADLHPAWSPSGTRLAFNRLKNGRYTIVVAKTDGSHARTVVGSRAYEALDPTWRPPTALPRMRRPTCRR